MEREVQKQVITAAKKASASMEEVSGVEASMNENDMKEYLELVINGIKREKESVKKFKLVEKHDPSLETTEDYF